MNVIFTCGGTAGHINPAIALAKLFRERDPEGQILFIGAEGGMEENLVPRAGFELKTIKISNFQRRMTPENIKHNFVALYRVLTSAPAARKLIREFQPDAIVGMGGYASYPAMKQGASMGIPILVHEANAQPGLTTKMIAGDADVVMVAFEESRQHYPRPERVEVVGMPVQAQFISGDHAAKKAELGYGDKPLVVSCWGSLGARDMNRQMIDFIKAETSAGMPFYHVHATGAAAWEWMPKELSDAGVNVEKYPDLKLCEYIYNMPDLMVAADLIISRAGASTLNEIAASGTPAIIVPSPNVTANHQEKNANVLGDRGGALVIRESDCSGDLMYRKAKEILEDRARCESMQKAVKEAAVIDSAERIYRLIVKAVEEHK